MSEQETPNHDWSQIMLDWEQSGLSQPEFCRQHKLSYNCFCYQRSKLNKRKSSSKAPNFSQIKLSDDHSLTNHALTLILPDQTRIIAPTQRHALVELLSALRLVSC